MLLTRKAILPSTTDEKQGSSQQHVFTENSLVDFVERHICFLPCFLPKASILIHWKLTFELHFSCTCLHLEEALWGAFLGQAASLLGRLLDCGFSLFLGLHYPTKRKKEVTNQENLVLNSFTTEVATFCCFCKCNAIPELLFFAWKQSHVLKKSGPVCIRGESLPHCLLPSRCWHSICSECWSGYLHYLE